ncbi:hypothetical protein A11A3_11332 [Alcanivorax hongdengensis A-11-3]|uniref:Toxin CptA n=1 Tax=Alcanivorax hongdengensis A-11-3 TaxID=1177179 RepID=L0WAG9_9GAMM|nr:hypothetical protein [Alcanivorax hongdengensis]EKF73946.1 hypothetical protein A11A3_11332 [Alcanivorax hongdengensis A-11-3]
MFWQRSLPLALDLGESRYPRRLAQLSLWLCTLALVLAPLALWWKLLLWVLAVGALRTWRPALVRRLYWRDGELTVTGAQVHTLAPPYRLVRLGPWLGLQTRRGWLHLFADQASAGDLQPFYQWLWVNRRR